MSNPDGHAYARTDATIAALYRTTFDATTVAASAAHAAAQQVGYGVNGIYSHGRLADGDLRLAGLATTEPDAPPPGWVFQKSNKMLVPARGKAAGAPARAWLAEHALPPSRDLAAALKVSGMPGVALAADMSLFLRASVFEHDGTLWAWWSHQPSPDECTWEPRRLSEYHAAKEAAKERRAAWVAERRAARTDA